VATKKKRKIRPRGDPEAAYFLGKGKFPTGSAWVNGGCMMGRAGFERNPKIKPQSFQGIVDLSGASV